MENARLPKSMEQHTIGSMDVGQLAYTVPWAMYADGDRRMWLHSDYSVRAHPDGTRSMYILRVEEGFHVQPVRGHNYSPNKSAHVGEASDGLPVINLGL